jgi:hypothetical protein
MAGLYAPYKVYTPGEVLTAADLNATDQNHITNQVPQMTDDYQLDLAQKRVQTDPASGLATSLAGELEQLRYALAKVGRVTFWDQIVGPPTAGLRGYANGFECATDTTDVDNDVTIQPGTVRSDDNTTDITLAAPLIKRLDATWVVGTNQGMLDGGAKSANAWYYLFAIMRLDTEAVDILASTSRTTPTMPTNYTKKRLIFAVKTDAANKNLQFFQVKDWVMWKTPPNDIIDAGTLSTARKLYTISTPPGFKTRVLLNLFVQHASTPYIYVCAPDVTDAAPAGAGTPLISLGVSTANIGGQVTTWTNDTSQIAVRAIAAGTTLQGTTIGYQNIT